MGLRSADPQVRETSQFDPTSSHHNPLRFLRTHEEVELIVFTTFKQPLLICILVAR